MRILFLTGNLNKVGGIQKYNRDFLKALNENREVVSVVEIEDTSIKAKINFIFKSFKDLLRFNPDIIICSHINFSPLGYFFKFFLNKEYIILTYGIEVWGISSNFKIKALKKAKIVTTISNYTKERLIKNLPEIKEKIFILPNTIDGQQFVIKEKSKALLRQYNLENKKIILTVSRLLKSEGYKGYDQIIRALSMIIKKVPNVRYLLVGAGDDVPRIKKLIDDLKLNNYVIMTGYVDDKDLVDYYNLADVFAMPSKGEGFGFVFIEALVCGKPVIAGDTDGSRDALLDGELGILVDPDNIKEISEIITKVLKKEIPSRFLNPEYLRKAVLDAYGTDKFKLKTGELLGLL